MIKTIPQAIDDIAVSLGAAPSAEIPTVAQALENVYTALGGTRTDLDTLVLPEVIDLVAPLIQGGGGGGGDFTIATATLINTNAQGRPYSLLMPVPDPDVEGAGMVIRKVEVQYGNPKEVPFALYKGKMTLTQPCFIDMGAEMPVVTGDAVLTAQGVVATGSFTFSATGGGIQ